MFIARLRPRTARRRLEPLVGFGRLSRDYRAENAHFSELTKHNLELLWNTVFNSFGVRFGVQLIARLLKPQVRLERAMRRCYIQPMEKKPNGPAMVIIRIVLVVFLVFVWGMINEYFRERRAHEIPPEVRAQINRDVRKMQDDEERKTNEAIRKRWAEEHPNQNTQSKP